MASDVKSSAVLLVKVWRFSRCSYVQLTCASVEPVFEFEDIEMIASSDFFFRFAARSVATPMLAIAVGGDFEDPLGSTAAGHPIEDDRELYRVRSSLMRSLTYLPIMHGMAS